MKGLAGDEAGVSSVAVQTVVVLALFALVIYEAIAIGVATFQVDDAAREVAAAAARAYDVSGELGDAEDAAAEQATDEEVELLAVEIDGERIVVSVRRQAATLVTHRVGPLEDAASVSSSARALWK